MLLGAHRCFCAELEFHCCIILSPPYISRTLQCPGAPCSSATSPTVRLLRTAIRLSLTSHSGLSDEQIQQICSTVGVVNSFRLIYDQETGRPKGYGFAEFADADAAASAVRNLDKHPIGGRELRVDFSHVDSKGDTQDGAPSNYQPHPPPQPQHQGAGGANGMPPQPPPPPPGHGPGAHAGVGPLPQGVELPSNLSAPDAISKTLATLPPPQLLDILSQMKTLVMTDPAHATGLLRQAPQLSYAIFQALLLLGLVDSSLIATVVEQSAGAGGAQQQQQQQQAMNMPSRPFPPQQGPPQAAYGAQMYGAQGAVPTPPMPPGHQSFQPPVVQQQQQQPPPPPLPPLPPGQEEMIKQLLQLSPADIERLPPQERQQIIALRQQYGGLAF